MQYRDTTINPQIFRAYDIRGIIEQDINADIFYNVGLAIGHQLNLLKRTDCFVGRDGRLSSDALTQAITQGLLDSGINVLDLGQVATPMVYFAVKNYDKNKDSGIMITGSHNAANYNGVKMMLAGRTLAHEDIKLLYKNIIHKQSTSGSGTITSVDITPAYIKYITADINLERPFKVAVDAGNGIAGPFIVPLLKELGCEVIPLFCDVDGNFPNHHPDPTIEKNLEELKKAVTDNHADLGLAFDGDADRIGVITNCGEMIYPDRLLMLYARDVLAHNPKATIVYDVKCSANLDSFIKEHGGTPSMCPTGHSIVKRILIEKNAAFAGEMSGHIFFNDRWFGFDDAMYSACRLLEILSKCTTSVDLQFAAIPNSVSTPEINIPIADEKKFVFMERFQKHATFPNAKVITIDGVRAETANGWGLLRASNTSPCLVARFEAISYECLDEIKQLFKEQLQLIDSEIEAVF